MNSQQHNGDAKLRCPYDKSHLILKSKMSHHLWKCAKSHPQSNIVVCEYNTSHYMTTSDMEHHRAICPDRLNILRHINTPSVGHAEFTPFPNVQPVTDEEDWDQEDSSTYDPRPYCNSTPILRNLIGAPRNQRIAFRHQERLRLSRNQ